jgi:hypothetical protein
VTARRSFLLWFGVFGAPLAWFLQLLVGWMFEEAACSDGSRRWWSGEHWWQVGLTVAALAFGLLGTLAALASLRASRRGELPDARGRVYFLAVFGLSASLFFLAITALAGTYVIILDPCTAG